MASLLHPTKEMVVAPHRRWRLRWTLTIALLGVMNAGTAGAAEPEPSARAAFPIEAEQAQRTAPPPMSPPPAVATAVAPVAAPEPVVRESFVDPRQESSRSERDREISDNWMLSVEGVTHAPIDVGFQAGLELPFGLRLFGGYGWVPEAYLDLIVEAATRGTDAGAQAVIDNGFDGGRAWRAQAGLRPFSGLGLYLDAGYSQLRIDGTLDGASLAAAADVPAASAPGDYEVSSTIHMWLIELGYQAVLANRIVLGVGLGVMGTIDASTSAKPVSGVENATEQRMSGEATAIVDQQIESYGVVPTLTVRLGLDLI